jgi:hypothetical protein
MEERLAQPQISARQSELGSRVRVHEGYQALKEHEATVRADTATVLAPNLSSERYRTIKDAQVQHSLDVGH